MRILFIEPLRSSPSLGEYGCPNPEIPTPGNSYVSAVKKSSVTPFIKTNSDISVDSISKSSNSATLASLPTIDSQLSLSVINHENLAQSIAQISEVASANSTIRTSHDSQDNTGFKTVTKKNNQSKPNTEINNEKHAEFQSKIWSTSRIQVVNSASIPIAQSLPSAQAINRAIIFANSDESPSVNSNMETIPIDHPSTNSTDEQIESPEAKETIDYDELKNCLLLSNSNHNLLPDLPVRTGYL
ncbi:hypothetical protein AVEN_96950-1 [Araneus ventricosus]|uniref:Uncharacterized protein n=1 Tax=Araneus ventricosus TaxID=182803 RepID=A0A4Y2MH01_ARAVE|nr:hypothetical protein AVEN_96950-1 [Araneus ventricosus]